MYYNMLYVMAKDEKSETIQDVQETILYFRTDYVGNAMVVAGHIEATVEHPELFRELRIDADERIELNDLLEENPELKRFNILTNVKQFCDHYSERKDE